MTREDQLEWALRGLVDVLDVHEVAQTEGVDPAVRGAIDRAKGLLGGYDEEPEDEEAATEPEEEEDS